MRTKLALALLLVLPGLGWAQTQPQNARISTRSTRADCPAPSPNGQNRQPTAEQQQYDVVVDIPAVCVERIRLRVRNLEANVSLNATVANLVRVQAGADVEIGAVDLTIAGVQAQAQLLVDLDDVALIADSVFTLLDNHPEIVDQLYGTVNNALGTVGSLAQSALQPNGVINQALLATLPVVKEVAGVAGQTIRTVRDVSGALIEYTLDQAGKISNARVVSGPTK